MDQSARNQTVLTCNLSNGLELHVSDGIVEGAAGLSEVVRVDVAHPDMSRLHLLGQRAGSSVDIDQEGLTWHGMIYISVNQFSVLRDINQMFCLHASWLNVLQIV